MEDKAKHKNPTLPCSEFSNLWASSRFQTAREILCRVGPYHARATCLQKYFAPIGGVRVQRNLLRMKAGRTEQWGKRASAKYFKPIGGVYVPKKLAPSDSWLDYQLCLLQ